MDLVNTTPVVARLDVAPVAVEGRDTALRIGTLLAKATFRWRETGELQLDDQRPEPLLMADVETPLGVVPRDDLPAGPFGAPEVEPARFEIVVLAVAYAPGGAPTPVMETAVSLGERRAALRVSGDRSWVGAGEGATISPATPFVTMPLDATRAFGGASEIEIDVESFLPVVEVRNEVGKGFDPSATVAEIAALLRCPAPYPRWDRTRALPNVEHPARLIQGWGDAPDPAGWGAWPIGARASAATGRAAPELTFDTCPAERRLRLEGLSPSGVVELAVPPSSLLVDAEMGDRRVTRAVPCIRWVVRPEERVLTVTWRMRFALPGWEAKQARSMRLRLT